MYIDRIITGLLASLIMNKGKNEIQLPFSSFFIGPGEEGTTKANKKRRKPQFNSEKTRLFTPLRETFH